MMWIALSVMKPSLSSRIDPRFGKCRYLIFLDTETMEFESLENPNLMSLGEAGVQTAQLVANRGVQAVLTGYCSPEVLQALSAAGIEVFTGVGGTVEEVVERYNIGELRPVPPPSAPVGLELQRLKSRGQVLRQQVDVLLHRIKELERKIK